MPSTDEKIFDLDGVGRYTHICILTLWRKNTNFVKKSDFTYSILCKEYDYLNTHNLQLLKFSHGP